MTALITLEEYNKNPSVVNAAIDYIANTLWRVDTAGNNPTIAEVKYQAALLRGVLSTASPEALVAEANKLIVLVDKTVGGGSLTTGQKEVLTKAIAFIASRRESNSTKPPAAPGVRDTSYKKEPDTISPDTWNTNHKAIVSAAEEAIRGLSRSTDTKVRELSDQILKALADKDNVSLYAAMGRLQAAVADTKDPSIQGVVGKLGAVDKAITENSRAGNGKTLEAPPKAAAPPPKPEPAAGKLCEPITHERWGVRFRFLDKPSEKKGDCETKRTDKDWDLKDWFLQLLPAMQSVVPKQGARDVPNAGPGLSFKFKNNMVKHKIPGSQPVYQMMGVDSAIITFVGTFTGDGGLGYINKVDIEDGELAESALKIMEDEATARRAGQPFAKAQKYGGTYPYGKSPVNAMFNPVYHVRNRARAPGGDTSSALVGSNNTGWLMDNSILRQGFFERDGCPGQCPPPSWGGFPNGQMDEAGGKFAWGGMGTWPDGTPYGDIGTRSQMDTHKLAYIAAYLDAYHEMVSFYKFAVQAGKLMEITINLRKTHDGLKPRVADPRMKGKLRSDTPDPLRDMHTGNPTFKGYLRTMSTWAQYSDRVWYVMEFEVVDHGLQGKKAVNLTNKVGSGGKSSSDGGVDGETPGSGGSDKPDSGDSGNSSGGSANPATSSTTPSARDKLRASYTVTTLPTKDGKVLDLLKGGIISDPDGNELTYNEAAGRLNFYDLIGINTLNGWYQANKVDLADGNIVIRDIDKSYISLDTKGKATRYTNSGEEQDITESVKRGGDLPDLNDLQRAVIDEWRAGGAKPVAPVPSSTPAPSIPRSTPTPIPIQPTVLPTM
ncbi:hypothetical protein [Microcoleus phage My-WqHQDG]|nr:hypothetical protein [Microcoleus phage My-WqHQDG]